MKSQRLANLFVPLVIVLAFVGVPAAVTVYVDWLWYGEVGYRDVFLRRLLAQALLGGSVAATAFALFFVNVRLALRGVQGYELTVPAAEGVRTLLIEPRFLRRIGYGVAAVAAILLGTTALLRWEVWLLYRHATPFGAADAVLGRDIGFYVFQLPFLRLVQGLLQTAFFVALGLSVAGHVVGGRLSLGTLAGPYADRGALRHLCLLVSAIFLILGWGAWLDIPGLLTEPSGIVHGASNTDVEARFPALRLLMAAAAVGAVLAFYQAFSDRLRPLVAAVGLYALVALGGRGYATVYERFVVAPNEQVRETPFIRHNIDATRKAFGLDGVGERELSGDALLTRDDIDRNQATLTNVPLWDHQPLLDTFGQMQEIRTYYDFASVDNDRYRIDGEWRQVMLSARELNSGSLPSRTWINERMTFTHGYGLTLGPVNQVTPEGLPVLFIKNLPPESSVPSLQVTEPSLYFGELSNDHVFVKTRTKEFHYPKGDDNVTSTYDGEGGVSVGTFWRKALFSIRFGSMKTLLSDDFTPQSRVIFHRRIAERVERVAPFLSFDPDPYLAISGGRLLWVQDAYTTSHTYPYSTPIRGGVNYIRNSVKVTVDAYHGTTTFYLLDPQDPVAATLDKAFPSLFRPLAAMPEDLRTRLRYPETIFSIQAAVFSTFHMTNPAVFYNKEDQWEVPAIDDQGGQAVRMQPYYTIMKLPGEKEAEFIQMLPFTPRQKDNLAAWMVARSDGDRYGQLEVFQVPKQRVVFGPRQVAARINQDQVISPQITLWNQQGSQVIQGTLLVIPIEESLLYIRPLYLRGAGGRIPELKRVILVHQNQIVMEETLEAGLERMFPKGGRPASPGRLEASGPLAGASLTGAAPPADADVGSAELLARASEHYERAIKAQREGNWALYGDEIKRLGETLGQMKKRSPAKP